MRLSDCKWSALPFSFQKIHYATNSERTFSLLIYPSLIKEKEREGRVDPGQKSALCLNHVVNYLEEGVRVWSLSFTYCWWLNWWIFLWLQSRWTRKTRRRTRRWRAKHLPYRPDRLWLRIQSLSCRSAATWAIQRERRARRARRKRRRRRSAPLHILSL